MGEVISIITVDLLEKLARLKLAKEEAEKEIAEYRSQLEKVSEASL